MKIKESLVLLAVLLGVFSQNVTAEGVLTVEQQNVYLSDGDNGCRFYAKVTNTGDVPAALRELDLELFSETGEVLYTQEYLNSFPANMIVQPGEYIYISEYLYDSAFEDAVIGDVNVSVMEDETGTETDKIPCKVNFELDRDDIYVYITFTNNTEETVYEYYLTAVLTDETGNICYAGNYWLNTVGVGPDSTITYKMHVDSDLADYYKSHQITPTAADGMVFAVTN